MEMEGHPVYVRVIEIGGEKISISLSLKAYDLTLRSAFGYVHEFRLFFGEAPIQVASSGPATRPPRLGRMRSFLLL